VQSTMNYEVRNSSAGRATVLGCAALPAVLSKNIAWSLAVTMNTYGFGTPGASLNQLRLLRWATTLIAHCRQCSASCLSCLAGLCIQIFDGSAVLPPLNYVKACWQKLNRRQNMLPHSIETLCILSSCTLEHSAHLQVEICCR